MSSSISSFNPIKKFLFRVLLFATLLAGPLMFLSKKYTATLSQLQTDKAHWVMHQRNGNYDFVFLGSSRVNQSVDAVYIDSVFQTNSLNLGITGASNAEIFLTFSRFLQNNNKVKVVLLQADFWGMMSPKRAFGFPFTEHKFLHLIGERETDSVLMANGSCMKHAFRKWLPFFKYSEYNSLYPADAMLLHAYKGESILNFSETKGASIPRLTSDKKFRFKIDWKVAGGPMDPYSVMSFRKILQLAKSRNIRLVLFTAPTYKELATGHPLTRSSKDTIQKLAKQFNAPWFDFEKADMCRDSSMFRDYTHLTGSGAVVFNRMLSDSLKKYLGKE